MKAPQKPIEQLRSEYESTLRAEIEAAILPENVKRAVDRVIEEAAMQIIYAALGIEKRYGQWEVDHANGRKTAIANALGEHAMSLIKSAMPAFIADFKVSQRELKAALKKEFNEQFDAHLERMVRERAREAAEVEATRLMDAFREEVCR